jgi:tetratricopeptide (TPR) repeat protein
VPESEPPAAAAPVDPAAATQSVDGQPTVALPSTDPRFAKAGSRPPGPAAHQGTVMSEPNFSESQIPADADEGRWEQGAGVHAESPAWTEHAAGLPPTDDDFADDRPEPGRKVGKWIALFVVVLIVGGAFYMFMFQREMVSELLSGLIGSGEGDRHEKFFLKGQENFLLDTYPAFRQADREYQKVLALRENDATTQAALAEMYGVWAQYLRDASLDARADALAAATGETPPDLREVERLEADFAEKLAEATRWADRALQADPELPAAHLAMAEIKRLGGELDAARNEIERARGEGSGASVDYVAAMVEIDEGQDADKAATQLGRVLELEELLRALYRQGRALASAGDRAGAQKALARLTELNSQHDRARDLLDRIGAGKPVHLTRKSLDEQAAAPEVAEEPDAGPAEAEEPEQPKAVAAGGGGGGGAAVPMGGSPDALLARAARMQETGNTAGAMTLFKKVLDITPSNIDALCGLAYCYLDKGSKGQAITYFRRALSVNGSYGPALIGLANTYKSQGQKAQALKWYKKYLQVRPNGRHAPLAKANIQKLEAELPKGGEPEGDSIFGEPPPGQGGTDDKPKDTSGDKPATDAPADPEPKPEPPPSASPPSDPKPEEQPPATEG